MPQHEAAALAGAGAQQDDAAAAMLPYRLRTISLMSMLSIGWFLACCRAVNSGRTSGARGARCGGRRAHLRGRTAAAAVFREIAEQTVHHGEIGRVDELAMQPPLRDQAGPVEVLQVER